MAPSVKIDFPPTGGSVVGPPVTVSGTCEPPATTIDVYWSGLENGFTCVSNGGRWSVVCTGMDAGSYDITAEVTDTAASDTVSNVLVSSS